MTLRLNLRHPRPWYIFKTDDWAGGVPAYARFSRTPMICLRHWQSVSRSEKVWVHGKNAIVCDTMDEVLGAIITLENNDELVQHLSTGVKEIDDSLFSDEYWANWEKMIANIKR